MRIQNNTFGGVYKITNVVTGDSYIGSSNEPLQRRVQHLSDLRLGKNKHPKLQANWTEFGEDAFTFEVIEYVIDPAKYREREQFWIDTLKPTLNVCKNSKGPGLLRWQKLKQARLQKGTKSKFYQRYLITAPDGRQMSTDNLTEFCRHFGLERRNMQNVASGVTRHCKGWICQSLDNPRELKTGPIPTRKSKVYTGFRLTSPDGEVFEVEQLAPFCAMKGLTVENVRKVAKGIRHHHKGWTCQFLH